MKRRDFSKSLLVLATGAVAISPLAIGSKDRGQQESPEGIAGADGRNPVWPNYTHFNTVDPSGGVLISMRTYTHVKDNLFRLHVQMSYTGPADNIAEAEAETFRRLAHAASLPYLPYPEERLTALPIWHPHPEQLRIAAKKFSNLNL